MRINALSLLAALCGLPLAAGREGPGFCTMPLQLHGIDRVRSFATPASALKPFPRARGHRPWTHAPHCEWSPDTGAELCVFTNARYHFGQGISVVAERAVAAKLVSAGLMVGDEGRDVQPKYEAVNRGDRLGFGLVVKLGQRIKAGETITVDYPTLVVPNDIDGVDDFLRGMLVRLQWVGVLQLPGRARGRTRGLARSKRLPDEIMDVVGTNAFTHLKGSMLHDILFTEASRINHDCRPNAFTRTNDTTLAMEVVALRDIYAGEEILVSYLDASLESTSAERHAKIRTEWNFECRCAICHGPGIMASDFRRRRIRILKEKVQEARGDAREILRLCKELIALYEDDGMVMPLAEQFQLAAYAANRLGDEETAVDMAGKSKRFWEIMFGTESQEVKAMEKFEKEPRGHATWQPPGAEES